MHLRQRTAWLSAGGPERPVEAHGTGCAALSGLKGLPCRPNPALTHPANAMPALRASGDCGVRRHDARHVRRLPAPLSRASGTPGEGEALLRQAYALPLPLRRASGTRREGEAAATAGLRAAATIDSCLRHSERRRGAATAGLRAAAIPRGGIVPTTLGGNGRRLLPTERPASTGRFVVVRPAWRIHLEVQVLYRPGRGNC